MDFLNLKEKFEELRYSCTPGDHLINGVKLLGAVVANTAIGAGKVAQAVITEQEKALEKHKRDDD